MTKIINLLKYKRIWINSFIWVKNCECTDLLKNEAKKWIFGIMLLMANDIGCGTYNDLREIVPEAYL